MKTNNDYDAAVDIEIESMLAVADAKEKMAVAVQKQTKALDKDTVETENITAAKKGLVASIKEESIATRESADASLEVAIAKEDLAKAIKEEIDSTKSTDSKLKGNNKQKELLDAESIKVQKSINDELKLTRDMIKEEKAQLKEERNARLSRQREARAEARREKDEAAAAKLKLDLERDKIKLERDNIKREREKSKLESELAKQRQMFDYSKKIRETNKIILALNKKEQMRREKLLNDISIDEEKDEELRKIKDKYRRQATKEFPKQMGLFERMNNNLKKFNKTTESAMAHMGARLLQGGGGFFSEQIDKMLNGIPVVSQGRKVYKFAKESIKATKENKRQRLIRERANELRKGDLNVRPDMSEPTSVNDFVEPAPTGDSVLDTFKKFSDKNQDKEILEELKDINKTVKAIHDMMVFKSMVNLAGGAATGLVSSISKGVAGALGSIGLVKALEKLTGLGLPDLNKPKLPGKPGGPKTPKPGSSGPTLNDLGGIDIDGDFERVDKSKTPGKLEAPTSSKKPGKASLFKRLSAPLKKLFGKTGTKAAASTLLKMGLRFAGPVGAALTVYEVASALGMTEPAEKFVSEAFTNMFSDDNIDAKRTELAQSAAPGYTMGTGSSPTINAGSSYPAYIPEAGVSHISPTVESAQSRVSESAKAAEIRQASQMNRMFSEAHMNVINQNNVNNHNNYGSSFSFNNEKYQTSYDKGTQVIR